MSHETNLLQRAYANEVDGCAYGPETRATCKGCRWRAAAPNWADALRLAAAHVEAECHDVELREVRGTVLYAAPRLPKYVERRVGAQ